MDGQKARSQIEAYLKEQFGKYLGIIIMSSGGNKYTLKLADNFMSMNLVPLYNALNRKDPEVKKRHRSKNAWGGSESIGGSPRVSGSGLTAEEILDVAQNVYAEQGWAARIWAFLTKEL